MKKRFTEEQIIQVLKEHEAGAKRKMGCRRGVFGFPDTQKPNLHHPACSSIYSRKALLIRV
jgi:hypothetical protein